MAGNIQKMHNPVVICQHHCSYIIYFNAIIIKIDLSMDFFDVVVAVKTVAIQFRLLLSDKKNKQNCSYIFIFIISDIDDIQCVFS
jgi:aconitase B